MPKAGDNLSRPLVSVVVPCRNRAHYLRPTLDSILQQDYPDIECIVMDGASTDDTVAILKSYGERIRWVSEPDDGQADAINKGWRLSHGEIITWLNADDLWEVPDAVSRAVLHFAEHPDADVIYGDCGMIDAEGRLIGMTYLHRWDLAYAAENCDHCIPQPASFIWRRALDRAGWLDTSLRQMDQEFWLRVGLQGKILYIPGVLAYGRNLAEDTSHQARTAAACVALTRKFLALPNVPPELWKKRHRILSNAYLAGIRYAYADGKRWNLIFRHVARAFLVNPGNVPTIWRTLYEKVVAAAPEDRRFRLLRWAMDAPKRVAAFPGRVLARLHGGRPPVTPSTPRMGEVERTFIEAQLPAGGGKALLLGAAHNTLALALAERGFDVTAVDTLRPRWPFKHANARFLRGDVTVLPFRDATFDLGVVAAAAEGVEALERRWVAADEPDADLRTMTRLRQLMKPAAPLVLTAPAGRDTRNASAGRVYGQERLPRLLDGFRLEREEYAAMTEAGEWIAPGRAEALATGARSGAPNVDRCSYALGCFVLRRTDPLPSNPTESASC